jgi:organic radical activating enzyme
MKAKTFCLAPWTHGLVHTNLTMRPCCVSTTTSDITFDNYPVWWNSKDMQELRSDLYNGIKNPACNGCWDLEELGKESLRQNYNNLFKKYVEFTEIIDSSKKNFILDNPPVTWDLRLGNLCNLKCVMCSSTLSDKIQQEIKENSKLINKIFPNKLYYDSSVSDWTSLPKAKDFFNSIRSTVRWLKLQGGEPLAIKNVRSLIESLNKNQTTVAITTNGTVLDKTLFDGISKLERIEFSISVEAAGPENDIIRYGSNWNVIKNNILKLKKLSNVDIQINHVLQITSVFYLKDVLQFSEENGIHLAILPLEWPSYLSLNACPTKYLLEMIDAICDMEVTHPKNQYIKGFLSDSVNKAKFDENLWIDFKKYVVLLDQMRPKKYSSVLKFKD